jgi:hypothetical protein
MTSLILSMLISQFENYIQFNINNHEHQKSARLLPGL